MMPLSSTAPAQPRIDVEQFRTRLFGIAYRMLGDVEESRDIVQDAFVRWHQADRSAVEVPEAWLVRVTTRLAIDRRRRLATERAAYVGPWLPEPIPTTEQTRPDRNVELASDLSMAFLVLLERLAPEERAAFLLREVFDTDYAEIAAALDRSEAAVRQIVHRARERVRDGKRRLAVAREVQEQLIERFLAAVAAEDREALLAVFDAHATFASDGGGKVSAARKVIEGADHIVRFLLGVQRKWGSLFRHSRIVLNGQPSVLTTIATDGRIFGTTSFAMEEGRITAVYRVMNPDKLRTVEQEFQM
jgi:RNA polymerase sigma-70 factor (ECF subfamily)